MATINQLSDRTGQITLDSSSSSEQKPIAVFSPSFQTHLERIYKSLTATSKPSFFQDVQRQSIPPNVDDKTAADPLSSLAAFHAYIASPAASVMKPASQHDASAPITDYFISSSHNTYLTGNQLYSDAAASAYTRVLLGGCRCVEIDIWDGEPDSESEDDDGISNSSSSSDSSSDEQEASRTVKDRPQKEKRNKATEGLSRLNSVSSKLGGILGRKPSRSGKSGNDTGVGSAKPDLAPLEPRVLHGHTLTKGTTFREVCYAIRDNAFVVSDLPVIVSLEVHASLEQQEAVVKILEDAFKGMLIQVTPEMEARETPPSLNELKRKILVKVKWAPGTPGNGEELDDRTDDLEHFVAAESAKPLTQKATPAAPKPAKVIHALSKHAIFTKGFSFRQFSQPEAKIPGHVFSLSEKAARQADEKYGAALFEHNRKYFMRVYPFGLRVDSSNLDPTFFWRRGAQIVALNWQNADKGMMLNHAMFSGESGWVLKPQGYRSTEPASTPILRRKLELSIEVLAGQNLVLPPGDKNERGFKPYVACYLHVETPEDTIPAPVGDDSTDSDKTSFKRVIKSSLGANPDFGAQKIQFPPLAGIVEELTFVRFKIKDDEFGRDSLAAWACVRLDRLQEGYRVVNLHRCDGSPAGGLLLVLVKKNLS